MRPMMRLAAIVPALLVGSTAGVSGLKLHVTDSFSAMAQQLPFKARKPIAHEARFTFYQGIYVKEKPQQPGVATNEPGGANKTQAIHPALIPRVGSGAELSKLYERKQADARADGNRTMESFYARMSESALQSEIATGRLNAQLGLVQSSLDMLYAAGAALRYSTGERLMKWTTATTGALDASARAGSTLHLGFFLLSYTGARFAIESRTELIVTAALETAGQSELVQSARTVELFTYRENNPAAAAAATGFVVYNAQLFAGNVDLVKSLYGTPFGPDFAVLANSAVAELYAKVEEKEQSAR